MGVGSESIIADIGSGTGIWTKQLLELNATVYGVEINDEMREIAEQSLSIFENYHSIKASAEQTTLPDNSVNFVSAAQAFHWFNPEQFRTEALRILKPNGKIIFIWNLELVDNNLFKEIGKIQYKYSSNFWGNTEYNPNAFFCKPAERFLDSFERFDFENNLTLTQEMFVSKMTSASGVINNKDKRFSDYVLELKDFFNLYQTENILNFPNKTVMIIGRL